MLPAPAPWMSLQPAWVALAALPLLVLGLLSRRRAHSARHQRGALIRSYRSKPLGGAAGGLALGGVALRPADECRHFKIIGTTGSGKSTAIRCLLRAALRRGDRAVIADPDGAYRDLFIERYRGDAVLNPFESGSRSWDLFAEIEQDHDVEQLASALLASSADAAAQEWRGYARTFLAALLRSCRLRSAELSMLWHLLAVASAEELRPHLEGSAAQPFLDPDNARMFGSIRAVALSAMGSLAYLRRQRTAPLSIRRWVRAGAGALFLPYRAIELPALRATISAWLRLAIFEALSAPVERDQRLWFVVDELDALGAVDGLKDALARLRKYGGRCVLGFQSIAQVSGTYGQSEAQTIVENCGNSLILRCAGSEQGGTSQFASRLIGEREVLRRSIVRSRDRALGWSRDARRSVQLSEQRSTESAVLASELEQLADLCGYLKTASNPYWQRIRLVGSSD